MFKNFKLMMIALICFSVGHLQASLQVAIAARDFCAGNSLVLITRDGNGIEKIAGCVSFNDGKTEFSQSEILTNNPMLLSIDQHKSAIVANVSSNHVAQDDESLIYLYFEVDPNSIVRVLVIKNSLLADNPFDVVEFSATSILDEDDEDDFFGDQVCDELSNFDLTDIQGTQAVELSHYDKILLGVYALWAVQATKAKQMYKKAFTWFTSKNAE